VSPGRSVDGYPCYVIYKATRSHVPQDYNSYLLQKSQPFLFSAFLKIWFTLNIICCTYSDLITCTIHLLSVYYWSNSPSMYLAVQCQ
jgi:hypothetical protein